MSQKDYFSGHAKIYAAFRPTYPKELYDFIFKHTKNFDRAWDCATGNGRVATVPPNILRMFAPPTSVSSNLNTLQMQII